MLCVAAVFGKAEGEQRIRARSFALYKSIAPECQRKEAATATMTNWGFC